MSRSAAIWITLLTFLLVKQCQVARSKQIVDCYYRNWAQHYKGPAKFVPEDIDPHLCSVINYASMVVDLDTHKLVGRQKNDDDLLARINKLKSFNPDLKVTLTVGGASHEKEPRFSKMVSSPATRAIFIKSVIEYLVRHQVDGISIDWEYPAIRPKNTPPQDKFRFTSLLQEMRKEFQKHNFLLTIAVTASPSKIPKAYEVSKIAKYVDWVNVVGYNLRGGWNGVTGCPSLMKGNEPTVPGAIDLLVRLGMPKHKINVGMAAYGRTYELVNASLHNVGDPITKKGGEPGLYTKHRGFQSYYELCRKKWTHETSWQDSSCGIPYASEGTLWASCEDPGSVRNKVSRLVNAQGLNGVSFWALDFDDRTGESCNQGKYPLIRAAKDEMKRFESAVGNKVATTENSIVDEVVEDIAKYIRAT